MPFYVNEDKPTNLVTIHRTGGPCRVPQVKREADGRWYGPYSSKEAALLIARGTWRPIKDCQRCKP